MFQPAALLRFASRLLGLSEGRCAACGSAAPALRDSNGVPGLCAACSLAMALDSGAHCPSCGLPMELRYNEPGPDEPEPPVAANRCGGCAATPKPWSRLYLHGRHAGLLRELIIEFKFNNRLGLAGVLGAMAVQAFEAGGGPDAGRCDLVVPVPLHRGRLLSRGFNQSLELARPVARAAKARLERGALKRIRATAVQSSLKGVQERRENIHGAFLADPGLVAGRRTLLIDDVLTTGATMEECARALRKAGAAEVDALVVSRTISI